MRPLHCSVRSSCPPQVSENWPLKPTRVVDPGTLKHWNCPPVVASNRGVSVTGAPVDTSTYIRVRCVWTPGTYPAGIVQTFVPPVVVPGITLSPCTYTLPLLPIMYRAYPPPPSDQELRRVMLCHVSVVISDGVDAVPAVAISGPSVRLSPAFESAVRVAAGDSRPLPECSCKDGAPLMP